MGFFSQNQNGAAKPKKVEKDKHKIFLLQNIDHFLKEAETDSFMVPRNSFGPPLGTDGE